VSNPKEGIHEESPMERNPLIFLTRGILGDQRVKNPVKRGTVRRKWTRGYAKKRQRGEVTRGVYQKNRSSPEREALGQGKKTPTQKKKPKKRGEKGKIT